MSGRDVIPQPDNQPPFARWHRRWIGLGTAAFLGVLAAAAGSCYKPDLNNAIYLCDGYACPLGLVCNSDKFCVYHPVDACTNGGIPAADGIVLCPGATNGCQAGYRVCASVPQETACQPPGASQPDLGSANACRPCCPK